MKRRNERGSALAAALVITILAAGLVAALVTYSFPFIRTSQSFNHKIYALYAAEAGLEEARMQISASDYDDVGNLWLMANSDIEANGGFLAYNDLPVGDALVDVRIFDIGEQPNQFYRVEATGSFAGRTVTLAWELRARDTFAKYMFFVDVGDLNVGTTTVRGAVYVGGKLNNYFGGAKYYKSVEAVKGVTYNSGATAANTNYFDTLDESAPNTQMPSTNEIANLHQNTTDPIFNVQNSSSAYSGGGSMNTYITFNGDQVSIVARRTSNNQIVNSYNGPLPSNGLIFSQGDVYVQGDAQGRVTIATMGKTNITGPIRQLDDDGDLAYLLKKDGAVVPNNDPGNTDAWTQANGYEYVKNPDFDPPAGQEPVIGLLSAKDIEILNSAPYNMELHTANFSATGRWSANLGSKKGNLRVLGSIVNKFGGWRYNSAGFGYAKSGEYIYDQNLLLNPPPFYLKVDKPLFGPRWELSSS
jgi:hypothetical protein